MPIAMATTELSRAASLLDGGDTDRLAGLVHALLIEVADLSERLHRAEARLAGDAPETDAAAVQARVADLVGRVLAEG